MSDLTRKRVQTSKVADAIFKQLDSRLKKIPKAVDKEWRRQARRKITRGVRRYLNALENHSAGNRTDIRLVGAGANVIEYGTKPYDVKVGLLNSPHAKVGKNGRKYVDVPMTSTGAALTRILGKGVAKHLRAMPTYESGPRGLNKRPATLRKQLTKGGARKGTLARVDRAGLGGVIKEKKAQGKGVTYIRFRRASRKSGPWWHHGSQGKHVAREVMRSMPTVIKRVLSGRDL